MISLPDRGTFVHRYPNGLVLLGEPMPWAESAAFTIAVPAGSGWDPADRSGLASVTCEMCLRGAGERDNRRFISDLESLGVEWSESVSAFHIRFSGACAADVLPQALEVFADVLRRPRLPKDELENARQGLLQDILSVEDDPADLARRELRRRFFPIPFNRPNEGEADHVRAVTWAEVREHYERHFRPNGTILGVAGKFDWERLRGHVGDLLADWPSREPPAVVETPRSAVVAHVDYPSQQTHIAVAYPSVPYDHPQYFEAVGTVGVLSGGMSARLLTEIRDKRGLCYSVHASHRVRPNMGAVLCYSGTTAERAQETLNVLLRELMRLKEGVLEEELDRLKSQYRTGLVMHQESSAARSAAVVTDWHLLGRTRPLAEIDQRVRELTTTALNRFLQENPPQSFTIVTVGPQPLEVPRDVLEAHAT
ncbi:MAG: insulinase family protein [Thermogutta sp.]|nr:insulinase family protein [Thermogutta sp.]